MKNYTVFNGEKLPVALSEDENIYYYRKYRLGDMDAREILIKHNLRLVFSTVMKHFRNISYEIEDLMSIGTEGLIKGIDNYDETKSDKISSYFSGCIIHEILNFLRSENKYMKKGIELVSIDDIAIEKDGCVIYNRDLFDIRSESIEDMVIDKMMDEYYKTIIYDMLSRLSDRDRKIFMLSYGFIDERIYKQREIASLINIDRGAVSMVLVRNLKKMREHLLFEEKRTYCRTRLQK